MKRKLGPKSAFFRPRVLIASFFCLTGAFMALGGAGIDSDRSKAEAAKQTQIPSGPPTLVPTPTCTPDWSPDADLPSTGVGLAGVYFQANGKFYGMGGRSSDAAGNEFTHPFEYDPNTNSCTTKSATYPDTHVNNMACGVLANAGTPYIYCVGGSDVASQMGTGRVFRYDPVTDVVTTVTGDWPPGVTTLPGGFTVFQNKLYILGGVETVFGNATTDIWEFAPSTNAWVQKAAGLPVPLGYIPTTTIGSLIYTGGGSDITGGVLTDTTNSFKYDPVADSISTIAPIPRATGETRALNFNGLMLVMGGGRTAPNPSNKVNIYNPANNTWTVGSPVPSFATARRNFPTDTDGSTRIWLVGGYAPTTATNTMEIFSQCPTRVLVTTVDDHNDGVCDAADCTLREAITAANANVGRIIAFAPGVTGTIQLAAALPSLNTNMAIQGPGANLLTVRRNIGGSYRIFNITANNVTISGLTIANGNTNAGGSGNGGGILNSSGTLTLTNVTVSGNTATLSSAGGILNSSGTLTLINSTISGNSATGSGGGGGIWNFAGTLNLINSTVSGNSATDSSFGVAVGGGIYNSNGGTVTLTNSTISGNTAVLRGGGIANSSSTLRSRNTIIALNTAPSGPDVFGTLTSENFNLIGNNSGVTIAPAQLSDQIGTPGSPINPMLGPLQNNGGPTLTRALLSGSTALDKGHSSGSATDQRGFPRTFDQPMIPNATGGDGTDIGAFELFAPFAVSRKTHGAAVFDIALPLTGTAGIECRSGGATGDDQVIVTFPSAVSLTSASVTTGTGSVSGFTVSGGQVTVNLTGISNVQKIVVTLLGVNDGMNTTNVNVPMGVLLGDTTGNGSVNATDVSQTKLQSGQAVTGSNFRTDVNGNGSINATDVSSVKLKSGTALP
jgi:CSLREA domain-containing protein